MVVKILKPPEGPKGRKDRSRRGVRAHRSPEGSKNDKGSHTNVVYHAMTHDSVYRTICVKLIAETPEQEQRVLRLMNEHTWALNFTFDYLIKNGDLKEIVESGIPKNLYNRLYSVLTKRYLVTNWLLKGIFTEVTSTIRQTVNATGFRVQKIEAKKPRLLVPTEWLDLKQGYLYIKPEDIKLKVVGWNRKYDGYPNASWARLEYSHDFKAFCLIVAKVIKPKCIEKKKFRGAFAVDANLEGFEAGSNDKYIEIRFKAPLERMLHYAEKLEQLKERYPDQGSYKPLERRKGLRHRAEAFKRKIVNIARYTPKKSNEKSGYSLILIAKEIVDWADFLRHPIVLENLRGLTRKTLKRDKPWDLKEKIILNLRYYQIDRWIISEAKLRCVPVYFVDPANTSTTCPICGGKMVQVNDPTLYGNRTMVCTKCGYKEDRDRVAIINLTKKFLSEHPEYR